MAKVRFTANTGNKTIVIGREIRLKPGVNEIEEDAIRKYGIDELPFVTMPPDWNQEKPTMKTTTVATKVEVTEDKPEDFVKETGKIEQEPEEKDETEGQNVLGDAMKREQSKIDQRLHTPAHIAAMSVDRAKKSINEVSNINTLVEVIQMTNKKVIKDAAKKRIAELDPKNPFGKE